VGAGARGCLAASSATLTNARTHHHHRHHPTTPTPPHASGFFSNRFFLYAVGGSIAGQIAVIYFAPLQAVFQTVPLALADWVYIIAIASTVLLTREETSNDVDQAEQ
jgi:magnesium-transporting ATPase (P-type)